MKRFIYHYIGTIFDKKDAFGFFSSKWKIRLAHIFSWSITEDNKIILNNYLRPFWEKNFGKKDIYVRENVPSHKADTEKCDLSKTNSSSQQILIFSCSKPIENVWRILTQKVYAERYQFE